MTPQEHKPLPRFYNYKAEGKKDAGYEALQDFFLSWTLRCAASNPATDSDKAVKQYATKMIYFLIYGRYGKDHYQYPDNQPPDDFKVVEVNTDRKVGNIDLVAIVKTNEAGEETEYVLSIENKWYTTLRPGQLERYTEVIQRRFPKRKDFVKLLITCDHCRPHLVAESQACKKNDYKFLNIDNIIEYCDVKPTGNALFDAYWVKSTSEL